MASNREALRKLSRKFPAPAELENILNSLRDKDDLSVAIVLAAIIEAALEQTITSKLKTGDSNLIGRIFLNRGPLSDFDSKILIAQAFGIITSPLAKELHSMKAIRNAFAHAKIPISFEHELIDKEVRSLGILGAVKDAIDKVDRAHEIPGLALDNKAWFLLLARILLIFLDELRKHPGSAREAVGSFLTRLDEPSPSP